MFKSEVADYPVIGVSWYDAKNTPNGLEKIANGNRMGICSPWD
jgi:formylglycine-generating enzyme required for sulfatase activity